MRSLLVASSFRGIGSGLNFMTLAGDLHFYEALLTPCKYKEITSKRRLFYIRFWIRSARIRCASRLCPLLRIESAVCGCNLLAIHVILPTLVNSIRQYEETFCITIVNDTGILPGISYTENSFILYTFSV